MPAKRADTWWLADQLAKERRVVNLIMMMLMLHVSAYDVLVEADRRDKVAAGPE